METTSGVVTPERIVVQNGYMPATRAYGGVSAEERRAQRRAALLDAALEVIGTRGFSAMTVSGLCKDAGLNDRYFAESFESREAVFSALIDQMTSEMAVVMTASVAAAECDIRSLGRAAIGGLVEYLTDDPRKARVALVEAPANPTMAQRRREVMDFFLNLMDAQFLEFFGAAETQQVSEMLRFAGVHLFGAMMETTTTWLAGGLPITRDELIDRATDLSVAVVEHVYAPARSRAAQDR
jgi:AcrR family transcriptional regulator